MHRFLILLFTLTFSFAQAEVLAGWAGVDSNSRETVDHSQWQQFLDQYLHKDVFGQTYFAYGEVTETDSQQLNSYVRQLEQINPLKLNTDEQKAYWFNLYNALTVKVVLQNYPIESIRDIGSSLDRLLRKGPWQTPLSVINGVKLSLDDIEHAIVRPKFNDYRVHFALNCAAMGCPNLSPVAFSGANIESLLQQAKFDFINHQRGVRIQHGKLIVSKIFDWYQGDFVSSEKQLTAFLAETAEPKLRAQLKGYQGSIKYEYDWSLNEVRTP